MCLSQTMHLKMSHLTLISERKIFFHRNAKSRNGLAESLFVRSVVSMLKPVFLEKLRKNSPKICIFMFLLNSFLHLHKRTLLSALTSLHRESPCIKLFLLVGISVLCMCKVLSRWRSCTVGGARTLCLFIKWSTCLKSLRTPQSNAIVIALFHRRRYACSPQNYVL